MIISPSDNAVDSGYEGSQQPIIQNLGPGNIYLGPMNDAETLYYTGLKLPVGAVYEYPATLVEGGKKVFLYADEIGTDVRIINVG